jgi:hypothetical protein
MKSHGKSSFFALCDNINYMSPLWRTHKQALAMKIKAKITVHDHIVDD